MIYLLNRFGSEAGFYEFPIQAGNVNDGDLFRADRLAGAVVGAIAE